MKARQLQLSDQHWSFLGVAGGIVLVVGGLTFLSALALCISGRARGAAVRLGCRSSPILRIEARVV
jgi:hypothetical protein